MRSHLLAALEGRQRRGLDCMPSQQQREAVAAGGDAGGGALRERGWAVLRLEEFFFPVFVRVMYELVFQCPPTPEAERLVLDGTPVRPIGRPKLSTGT